MKQLTTAAVLGFTLNVSALTQYVGSGTSVTGTLTELSSSYAFSYIKD